MGFGILQEHELKLLNTSSLPFTLPAPSLSNTLTLTPYRPQNKKEEKNVFGLSRDAGKKKY